MKKDKNRRAEQLGMPYGSASSKLRKMVLFDLVRRFNLDDCYRCGEKITDLRNFTIEHKKPWLDVSADLFWDLDNIAFSHLACNVRARTRPIIEKCWRCRKNPRHQDTWVTSRKTIGCLQCNPELRETV